MKKIIICAAACICFIACKDDEKKSTTYIVNGDTASTAGSVKTDTATTAVTPPMDSASMMKAWQAYMTPGPEHKMIAMSNGTWDEEVKMYMSPDAPPEVMKSTCVNSMMMNGLFQQSVHKGMYNNMPFEGRGTLAYNNLTKKYQSSWIDNMGSGMMNMEGTYDEASKTINMSGMMADCMVGKDIPVRETMKFIDDKNQLLEMFNTRNGKETKSMEIKYTKK